MVRLQIGGIWIDLNDFIFELKWKHPIQNLLKGESSTYSTDMTVPLTANNKLAFDYQIFLNSGNTNKYLYGQLVVNGSILPVRCYVKSFSSSGISFYLEQFRSGALAAMLKDETTLDNIYLPVIQSGAETDIIMNLVSGMVESGTLPEIFTWADIDLTYPRVNVYATSLLETLATFYGLTLINQPTNYLVFCNQWVAAMGLSFGGFAIRGSALINTWHDLDLIFDYSPTWASVVGNVITATVPYYLKMTQEIWSTSTKTVNVEYRIISSDESTVYLSIASEYNLIANEHINTLDFLPLLSNIVPNCKIQLRFDSIILFGTDPVENNLELFVDYSQLESPTYPDLGTGTQLACWQNLPKITYKTLLETLALCAGKMISYDADTVTFVDFEDVFSPLNAIDVSDKLIEWKTKEFKFLDSKNNTVNYPNGDVIATVIVADKTLPDTTNSVATIDAVRIQDEALLTERNTTDLVVAETTDSHFDVIDKLPLLYSPLVSPKLFEADFIYFADNKRPLLVRQLGGIFIALESITTTKNTITLKLLKIL